jgi:hypothetical protein
MVARSWKLFNTGLARLLCVKETLAQQTEMVRAVASLNRGLSIVSTRRFIDAR